MEKREDRTLLDAERIDRILTRIAHEILERNRGSAKIALVGILRGGEPVMRRLAEKINTIESGTVPTGTLDIGLYRDDLNRSDLPQLFHTKIDFDLTGLTVILVDDVLFTGRTVRAAMDALMDLGRPQAIQLGVLIDRGHRELPIRADYIGRQVETDKADKIRVLIDCAGTPDQAVIYSQGEKPVRREMCD